MNTAVRLAGFAAALMIVFGLAWGIGAARGGPPASGQAATGGHDPHAGGHQDPAAGPATGPGNAHPAGTAGGLAATALGYTLLPRADTVSPGVPGEYAFTVTGSDARPVTSFDVRHDRKMHVVVVRRDAAWLQHLHPTMDRDGVWRSRLTLPAAGVYRVYADFAATGGPELVLGTDLFAPGEFTPVPAAPARVAQVDGYQVRLDGELTPGGPAQLFATVSRDGRPVTDLEPHLDAFGHLIALRTADLAYLHVHPDGAPPAATDRAGPAVGFTADVETAGTYRIFVEFRHAGAVHIAGFALVAPGGS